MPLKTSLVSAILAAAALTAACGAQTPSAAQPAKALPAADAQSRKAVDAANAFLATLSETQKKQVMFAFDDKAQRARWTNLPQGMEVTRRGVSRGEMNAAQKAALNTLLAAILSPQGMRMVDEQMAADDVLKSEGGPLPFGNDKYWVSFLGAPSTTSPWILQFGGHHLGLNIAVVGPNISLSPSLTGGQPLKFMKEGKPVYIVEREVSAANALMASLTPAQKAKVVLGPRKIDLVLGPGHDGQKLQPEGLPASEMTEAQKALLFSLIEARMDILNADDLAVTLAPVKASLNQTWFAWYGPTSADRAYFRVTNPKMILEFSPQDLGGDDTNHVHNMYRDPTNEYGAGWAPIS